MKFIPLELNGAYRIQPEPFKDTRGIFFRYFCKSDFKDIGHDAEWVQLNHSITQNIGTIRGMHFQLAPFSEIKMVKCVAGAVYDVIVDIRRDSPTFLKWTSLELSAENHEMIYIPAGFAHGFQSLQPNSQLIYHHSEYYTPGHEGGLRYNDPWLNIEWPLAALDLSERDKTHPLVDATFKGINL